MKRVLCILTVLLFALACGSTSPTAPDPAPSPSPTPGPSPSPGPAPSGPGSIQITIVPNPVPYSGESFCSPASPHTWQYDQVLKNSGTVTVTLTVREDFLDDTSTSKQSNLNVVLTAGQELRVQTRWCSTTNVEHRAATNWSGSDTTGVRITIPGPEVRLLPK